MLVAEPDSALRRVLAQRLEGEGCDVRPIESSDGVMSVLGDTGADVLVVATWPRSEFLTEVRKQSDVVVIAMLPRDTPQMDALDALDAGADDFVVKPFSPRELVARLHARVRRVAVPAEPAARRFEFGELTIDEGRR